MSLKNKKWRDYFLNDVFNIKSTKSGIDKNKLEYDINRNVPYITRTDKNNGLDSLVSIQNEKYAKNDSNVITIGLDTQTIFYQPFKFFTGQNIQVLNSDALNKDNALFFTTSILRQMEKFNWGGNGATLSRLERLKITLPKKTNDKPDYKYMEKYIKQEKIIKIEKYKLYIKNRIDNITNIDSLKSKKWGEFSIAKLFNLASGKAKGLNHLNKEKLEINYLGATNLNNGVMCQVVKVDKITQKGNCIVFIRNGEGSMGYSIYKAEDFIATSDVTVGYNKNLNKYNGMFITTIADTVRGKYNFGYKRNPTRLAKEKIMLPINDKDEPDYEYMEDYMKNLEYKKVSSYINYIEKSLSYE